METYNLAWTQGTAAASQDVISVVSGSEVPLSQGLDPTVNNVNATFTTDSAVEWFVRTFNADKSKFLDSVHATFTATNQTPIQLGEATNLTDKWVSHQ